jgi:hypothetical protein
MYTKGLVRKQLEILAEYINTSFVTKEQAEKSFYIVARYIADLELELELNLANKDRKIIFR